MIKLIHDLDFFLNRKVFYGKNSVLKLLFTTLFLGTILNVVFYPGGLKNVGTLLQSWPDASHVNTLEVIQLQHADLTKHLEELQIPQEDHRFKMTYRLFLPMLSRIIGINYFFWKVFFIQLGILPLFMLFLYQWLSQFIKNPTTVFYLLVSLSTTYYISSFWQDIFLYGDAIAFFLLLLCLRYKHPVLLFACAFLVGWIDERAFVSLFGLLAWWGMFQFSREEWMWSRIWNISFVSILLAMVSYIMVRLCLHIFVFPPNSLSLQSLFHEFIFTLYENIKCLGFSLWRGYKGTLGFAFLFILINVQHKEYLRALAYASLFFLSILFAMGAYDLSRGLTYFFPFILFAVVELRRSWGEKDLHLLFFMLILFTISCSNFSYFRLPGAYPLY